MPTYLNHTFFHVPARAAPFGVYSIIPWIVTFFTVGAAGWLSDSLIGARVFDVGRFAQIDAGGGLSPSAAVPLCLVAVRAYRRSRAVAMG